MSKTIISIDINADLVDKAKKLEEEISKLETQKKQLEWENRNQPYYEYHKMIEHQQETIEHYFKETVILREAFEICYSKFQQLAQETGYTAIPSKAHFIEQAKGEINEN